MHSLVARARRPLRPVKRWARRVQQAAHDALPDRWVLDRRFYRQYGRWPANPPVTWPEKMHWSLLHHRDPEMSRCADKVAVREYVAERGAGAILNECLGVWSDPATIEFDLLPRAFVLKVAGGWNEIIRCPDKERLDLAAARAQLRGWLNRSHYWREREWVYRDVPPRILAEAYLGDNLPDFKVFCFAGEPGFIEVDTDRFTGHRRDCYWPDWTPAPFRFSPRFAPIGHPLPEPPKLRELLGWAHRLAEGWPFVRVDLYALEDRIVFGEMTWQPGAGTGLFAPDEWNRYWGERLPWP